MNYRTQVIETTEGYHLKIWRDDGKEIRATWSEIQQIKNEQLGEDVYCVEIYPEEDLVVDEVNYRHLWSTHPLSVGFKR